MAVIKDISKTISDHINGDSKQFYYLVNILTGTEKSPCGIMSIIDKLLEIVDEIPLSVGEIFLKIFTDKKPWYTFGPGISGRALEFCVVLAGQNDEMGEMFLKHICAVICNPSQISSAPEHLSRTDLTDNAIKSLVNFFGSMPHFEERFISLLLKEFPSWGRRTDWLFEDMACIFSLCFHTPRVFSYGAIKKILFSSFDLLIKFETRDFLQNDTVYTIPTDLDDLFNSTSYDKVLKRISSKLTAESSKRSTLFWLYCMCILKTFPQHHKKTLPKDVRKEEWKAICAVFDNLRESFVRAILPLQSPTPLFPLLVTFMSSLHSSLTLNLLEKLWAFVIDPRQTELSQINCVRFLADYLARCRHLSEEIIVELLQDFASWCIQYTYHRKGRPVSGSLKLMRENHRLFYTIFESIIYIVVFRQAKLIGSSTYRTKCTQIPLIQLINSPFKPLEVIEPNLRVNFLTLSFTYRMNWTAVVPPTEESSTPSPEPLPSFPCALIDAVKSIPISGHLDLFEEFVLAKRTQKRAHENGNGIASSSEESTHPPEKRPCHFDAKALNYLS